MPPDVLGRPRELPTPPCANAVSCMTTTRTTDPIYEPLTFRDQLHIEFIPSIKVVISCYAFPEPFVEALRRQELLAQASNMPPTHSRHFHTRVFHNRSHRGSGERAGLPVTLTLWPSLIPFDLHRVFVESRARFPDTCERSGLHSVCSR